MCVTAPQSPHSHHGAGQGFQQGKGMMSHVAQTSMPTSAAPQEVQRHLCAECVEETHAGGCTDAVMLHALASFLCGCVCACVCVCGGGGVIPRLHM
jgi:hypothetical protein